MQKITLDSAGSTPSQETTPKGTTATFSKDGDYSVLLNTAVPNTAKWSYKWNNDKTAFLYSRDNWEHSKESQIINLTKKQLIVKENQKYFHFSAR
ncbi:hypothetical protein AGMMS49938_11840 [Fibrobacterales bacterium]|nr:hypothetical protein AGMMS49938_11840 [Fibrobacterales bacterium]